MEHDENRVGKGQKLSGRKQHEMQMERDEIGAA